MAKSRASEQKKSRPLRARSTKLRFPFWGSKWFSYSAPDPDRGANSPPRRPNIPTHSLVSVLLLPTHDPIGRNGAVASCV